MSNSTALLASHKKTALVALADELQELQRMLHEAKLPAANFPIMLTQFDSIPQKSCDQIRRELRRLLEQEQPASKKLNFSQQIQICRQKLSAAAISIDYPNISTADVPDSFSINSPSKKNQEGDEAERIVNYIASVPQHVIKKSAVRTLISNTVRVLGEASKAGISLGHKISYLGPTSSGLNGIASIYEGYLHLTTEQSIERRAALGLTSIGSGIASLTSSGLGFYGYARSLASLVTNVAGPVAIVSMALTLVKDVCALYVAYQDLHAAKKVSLQQPENTKAEEKLKQKKQNIVNKTTSLLTSSLALIGTAMIFTIGIGALLSNPVGWAGVIILGIALLVDMQTKFKVFSRLGNFFKKLICSAENIESNTSSSSQSNTPSPKTSPDLNRIALTDVVLNKALASPQPSLQVASKPAPETKKQIVITYTPTKKRDQYSNSAAPLFSPVANPPTSGTTEKNDARPAATYTHTWRRL